MLIRTIILAAAACGPFAHAQRAPLTIDRMLGSPALAGTAPSAVAWASDSRQVAFLWNDRGLQLRELWVAAVDGGRARRVTAEGEAVLAFVWTPDSRGLVVLREGDLWLVRVPPRDTSHAATGQSAASGPAVDGASAVRLTSDGGGKSDVEMSPDGRLLSFLRDGDLWVVPAGGGAPRRLTNIGVRPIGHVPLGTYYRPDTEIGTATWGGDAPAYAWAPDSRHIAVHLVDRRGVRRVGFPYYLGDSTTMNVLRRGYPGDTNEVRRMGILDVASGAVRWLELPDERSARVVNFAWSPTGSLFIDRESDDAIARTIHWLDAPTGSPRLAWHDRRLTRVYNDIASTWHPDGRRLLITADLEDRYRLYTVTPGDSVPHPVTPGTADVAGAAIATTTAIFYAANAPDPAERHVYALRGNERAPVRLTSRPGTYTPFASPDGRHLALLFSDDVTPTDLYLANIRSPQTLTRVTQSPSAEFARVPWQRPRYLEVPSRTAGITLRVRLIEPPGLDAGRRYPVLFGPVYSNTVRNRWGGVNGMLQQLLAIERGYIVAQVDVRGSTGYGRDFREKFLMDWGGGDLDDLEDVARYLKTLPYVEGSRLGIWGSSYGGTLVVYSLLRKPGLFAAGVAGAPATDPRYFGSDDVAIARRPETHPEAYRRGAAQYAANLRDRLLIIHGMEDDVVPFQTSVALAEALMRAGKDFDFAFAPAATHGWTQRPHYARYLLQKLVDFFERYVPAASTAR